jgi:hypothetical protein
VFGKWSVRGKKNVWMDNGVVEGVIGFCQSIDHLQTPNLFLQYCTSNIPEWKDSLNLMLRRAPTIEH